MNADNQQERLRSSEEFKWFLAGLIEGEGSMCISLKQTSSARFGYYIDPEFFIYQHKSARELLEQAKAFFGTGSIVVKPGNKDAELFHSLEKPEPGPVKQAVHLAFRKNSPYQ